MIRKLDNLSDDVAKQIFTVFQSSYKVEAALIDVVDFPPLARTVKNIQDSGTLFYGYFARENLAGVIEITTENKCLNIDSLTVHPDYFRKGIAGRLIEFSLNLTEFTKAIVETAVDNKPAITLYKKHGFREFKRWIPSHGIPKIAMSRECTP